MKSFKKNGRVDVTLARCGRVAKRIDFIEANAAFKKT
jgi:hypothetical protein